MTFWGNSSCNFDEWIISLESAYMDVGWSEEIKINILYVRLRGTAREFLEEYIKRFPVKTKNCACVSNALHDRFHGRDTKQMYQPELHIIVKTPKRRKWIIVTELRNFLLKAILLNPTNFSLKQK